MLTQRKSESFPYRQILTKDDPCRCRPALFLDRDGVINVDRTFVSRAEEFEFIPGAANMIRRFNRMDWRVIVATNQTGIARNLYTEDDMHDLHAHMLRLLDAAGARIDAIYYCPFHQDGEVEQYRRDSDLRKPRPGMLLQAMKDLSTDTSCSFMIGDKLADIQAANAAGVRGFLFEGGDVDVFACEALASMNNKSD